MLESKFQAAFRKILKNERIKVFKDNFKAVKNTMHTKKNLRCFKNRQIIIVEING
jgi:hypothetical protein